MSTKPHSADYFGDTRDFWWNRDFLGLMSARWKLGSVRRVLDVGCGVGHWGRSLAPFLSADCVMVGVDRESRWIDEARTRSSAITNFAVSFRHGEAERLPFPNDSFDMVTCQTVLIHVKDPRAVIQEMIRVLEPGGLVVIVEPNNLVANLCSAALQRPISELIGLLEFQMICERGKMTLGEGFNSSGPSVPGWLSEQHIEEIDAYMSDKTTVIMPPYDSAHARAVIREVDDMSQRHFWIWSRDDTYRYFLAGGGAEEAFGDYWQIALDRDKETLDAAQQGTLKVTYAPVSLLVSGRKKKPNHAPVTVFRKQAESGDF